MKTGLLVKRPNGKAKSYSVIPYTRNEKGAKVYGERIAHEALSSLNHSLKTGLLTGPQAELQFKKFVLPLLKKESDVLERVLSEAQISEKNLECFRRFWDKEYEGANLVAPDTARWEFFAALKTIEPLSLLTSSKEQLQKKLNTIVDGSKHKKLGARLNQLLKYYERSFKLKLKEPSRPRVRYLALEDFKKVLPNVAVYKDNQRTVDEEATADLKALYMVLFGTGVRFGEAFVLDKRELKKNNSIFISQQIRRNGDVAGTKNGDAHNTILIPQAREAFLHWCSIDRERYRGSIAYRAFKRAVKATFKDRDRQVNLHDLRHSYVIHMLGLGIPLDKCARLIGDTLTSCELHYAGKVSSDAEIDMINSIMQKSGAS